jgi:hypothetical protein
LFLPGETVAFLAQGINQSINQSISQSVSQSVRPQFTFVLTRSWYTQFVHVIKPSKGRGLARERQISHVPTDTQLPPILADSHGGDHEYIHPYRQTDIQTYILHISTRRILFQSVTASLSPCAFVLLCSCVPVFLSCRAPVLLCLSVPDVWAGDEDLVRVGFWVCRGRHVQGFAKRFRGMLVQWSKKRLSPPRGSYGSRCDRGPFPPCGLAPPVCPCSVRTFKLLGHGLALGPPSPRSFCCSLVTSRDSSNDQRTCAFSSAPNTITQPNPKLPATTCTPDNPEGSLCRDMTARLASDT